MKRHQLSFSNRVLLWREGRIFRISSELIMAEVGETSTIAAEIFPKWAGIPQRFRIALLT